MKLLAAFAFTFLFGAFGNAQESMEENYTVAQPEVYQIAPAPVVLAHPPYDSSGSVRLIPFFGAGSLGVNNTGSIRDIGDSSSFGLWADFGRSYFSFNTGLSFDSNRIELPGNISTNFNTWGIPVTMKWNFFGKPNSTIFGKAGFNFVDETSNFLDYIDTVGVLGFGANIPLGTNASAILLEADYNTLLSRQSYSTSLEGFKFFGGLSMAM